MTKEKFEIIIVPSFQKDIERIKEKKQLELIYKSIEKIERMGKNAIKLLHSRDKYILGEIKFMNPPYRLYVIINQENEKFYIVRWEHKEKQQKVIDQLMKKLEHVFEGGIKNIVELFSH
jgi:mRNA-degrading endonuclease RelE of RelBE toxin-antitoxin system